MITEILCIYLFVWRTERLFGYSLSVPNLNMRLNLWSPISSPLQDQHHRYQGKPMRKIRDYHSLFPLVFEIDSSQQDHQMQDVAND